MEQPSNFLTRYAPRFLRQPINKPPPTGAEIEDMVKIAHVTNSIMPELHDLLMGSQLQLILDIRRLTWRSASRADIENKQFLLDAIRKEACRGDDANQRLAERVNASSDRRLIDAIKEEIAKPADPRPLMWWQSVRDSVAEYRLAAEDLTATIFAGIRHEEILAGRALYISQRLIFH